MRKTVPMVVAVLLLGAGVAIGWFGAKHFSGPEAIAGPDSGPAASPAPVSGPATSPQSGEPADSFGIGDPEILAPAPSWDTWKYPHSKVDSSNSGSESSMNGVEIGSTQTITLVTPDEFDDVWAFYKEECQLVDLSDGPVAHTFEADQVYNVKLFDDVQTRSFAGPTSDALATRAFTVHSWRYQLVGFIYRLQGESTSVLLVYRPNIEFVRMLRDRMVKK